MNTEQIRAGWQALQAADLPSSGGRTLAYVYDSGLADADQIGREALAAFAASNALDPTAFPSLLVMEQELVGMAADLLAGPPETVGNVTSGGTESLLLAVQGARDAHPEIERPELVLPVSAHASLHKAAHYFGVTPVFTAVDPLTGRAIVADVAARITERTVLVVGSAPSYAHGVIDPIEEIASLAQARGIRCHVDACIGGWLLPQLQRSDPGLPRFAFDVPGVTSISVDLHKYGYTPKGVSLLLHRDAALRRPQFFASAAWPGYTMINSTTQSTRSGGPVAAAWAVTRRIGDAGYRKLAEQVRSGLEELVDGLGRFDGLRVVGEPQSSLLALAAADPDRMDVFTLTDELLARGWYVQPQLRFDPFPATMHLSLSAATAPLVPEFLAVLAEAVDAAVAAGPAPVDPALVAMLGEVDPGMLDERGFADLLGVAGLIGPAGTLELPRRMAPVNALLDLASPALREALMVGFIDLLSRPRGRTQVRE